MRRLTAAFAALILIFGAFGALAKVEKTELVYGKIDAAGKLLDLYIVNAFESDAEAEHIDYGKYSELTNLSDTTQIDSGEDGAVTLPIKAGRSYYQGKPVRQELPWRFDLSYTLDGKRAEPSELSGASGKLAIRLDVEVVEALMAYAQLSTLQITLSLDGDRCFDIEAPTATLAHAGGNISLSYVVLPGQSASYEISFEARDFAMPGLQIAGVKMAMDVEQYKKALQSGLQGNPMAEAMGPVIENIFAGMVSGEPLSFADSRNGVIQHLQFIILGEGIPEKERPAPAQEEEETSQETPISRILALFFQ